MFPAVRDHGRFLFAVLMQFTALNDMIMSMKRTVIGILAHVDAGKTTCIEGMLYRSGTIRKMGRVDHGDAYLDYDEQERDHGITIYSKEAVFTWKDTEIQVIDTPGHADFSSEMERCLRVLDLAVILISGQDGVQSHTQTIWKCLEHYHVPAIVFVNKMDISYKTKQELMQDLKQHLSDTCVDLSDPDRFEKLALISDEALNEYMETGSINDETVRQAVYERKCTPCLFGSALKLDGIDELMDRISWLCEEQEYPSEFGARVYKISADENGARLTHIRMTGGVLKSRQKLSEEDKVDQIRVYSGKNWKMVDEAEAGMICVLKGPVTLEDGQGLGFEEDFEKPMLNAYMTYRLVVPKGADTMALMRTCSQLMQEDPALSVNANEETHEIQISIMGEMQMEVLQKKIKERCGIDVLFTTGKIIYMETIRNAVTGSGHFEPLRHYAEAHVRLEPLERGSGIIVESQCSQDDLSMMWQRSILSALNHRVHRGVLTRSRLTDVRIVLIAGRGHLKHTEGGDFREAACRAVRQALMKAENILLEPFCSFTLRIPSGSLSRAMYDFEMRQASIEIESNDESEAVITGRGPVRTLMEYQNDVTAYSRGKGRFIWRPEGYDESPQQDMIVESIGYDPDMDYSQPAGSVFCAHGSGFYVPWDKADEYMHIQFRTPSASSASHPVRYKVSEDELKKVFEMTTGRNKNEKKHYTPKKTDKPVKPAKPNPIVHLPVCMIVDGYNMIYGWEDLKELSKADLYAAREKLIDRLFNYMGYTGYRMLVVFDGYKVKDNMGTEIRRGDMTIIFTRADLTADAYIDKAAHELKNKYRLIVASSDALVQNAVFAQGASRMSARELASQLEYYEKQMLTKI